MPLAMKSEERKIAVELMHIADTLKYVKAIFTAAGFFDVNNTLFFSTLILSTAHIITYFTK